MKSGDTRERPYTGLSAQSVPPTSRWENRPTYGYGAQGQGGDYLRGAAHDQRRDGPIQCWRCHGFGHTQSRCPNKKKPIDYTPLCRYCSGEGHFDEDSQEHVPTIGVVFKTPNPQEGSSSSMHFVDAYQAKKPHKEPTVAVVTRTQEYSKKHREGESEEVRSEKIAEHGEVENQVGGFAEQQEFEDGEEIEILPPVTKEFVPGIAPFPERLRAPKCRKERQSLEEVDIVKLLADTEVTLDIGTLLKCSPAYRKQFYNEYIKKPRKARNKKRQDKEVQGMIQSIMMQIDSNAPAVTVKIKGYAVPGAQLDSGAAVNLMIEFMMKALGLNHMEETPMSLRMADQTQVKPAGLLKNVSIVVGGLEFKVDYLIVRPRTSEATFSILLGRPWLVQAECVHDWRTGFITIGPKADRIQLQVSPNLTGKKSTTAEERELKAKEKVRQEMARVRFALRTETSKDLLQDGCNLQLSKLQHAKVGEYKDPLVYKDDLDQELLGWLTHTSEFECYMLSIDARESKATQYLEKGTSKEELKLELAPTMEVQQLRERVRVLEAELLRRSRESEKEAKSKTKVSEAIAKAELKKLGPIEIEQNNDLLANHARVIGEHFPITTSSRNKEYSREAQVEKWEVFPKKFLSVGSELLDGVRDCIKLALKNFSKAFAWSYSDLRGIDPRICQHYIDLEEGTRPICQRLRRTNPVYSELIKLELTKL
ncbi:hypothetical protein KP509_13G072100 [Ceratopteris richardii]|uniref:CCHC-type domain-containing protein n=1 Tax=Ceratopteris richardii TaxID=49495 RepID=A0A8T2TK00_CERRI|nr:hypothetical protein KP509_13G072100 [Ceratopteris richardii]